LSASARHLLLLWTSAGSAACANSRELMSGRPSKRPSGPTTPKAGPVPGADPPLQAAAFPRDRRAGAEENSSRTEFGIRPGADHRSSQAQQDQAQRLENLGQLAGGIAHDFNNLLAVILNYASFVSEDLSAATEVDWPARRDSALGDLGQISLAAERAASLTRQLLSFARQEVIRPQVLDLNAVVSAVETMLRPTIGEHVEVITALASDLWHVLADPGQVEQVLVNLAVNARDAMPGGGTLRIETKNMNVESDNWADDPETSSGHHVRLRVIDTGTGMTPEVIEHVFEPFFTTKDEGGTGLGLSTVYGIVAQAEGRIHIRSTLGTGTTFTILFPVTSEIAPAGESEIAYEREPKGEVILLVEDEQALRDVTQRILIRSGYRVLTAANGPDALELAARQVGEVHLLLTDVVMPSMLGKEVAERMLEIKPEVEVLFMSGYARRVLASQGRLDPNVALIEKPFSEAELLKEVGLVLNGNFRGFKTLKT
jgi:signal transduction histidine kinase/CheY-like chemotaxis protein